MNETYIKLRHFVGEMRDTTSMLKKKEIIRKYKDNSFITEVLKWTLDPYKTYNVTSKNCKKLSHLIDDHHHDSLFDLLKNLDCRVFTGHDAIAMVNGYCAAHKKWVADLVYCIIDRNLQIRAKRNIEEHKEWLKNSSPSNKLLGNMATSGLSSYSQYQMDLENDGLIEEEINAEVNDLTEYGGEDDALKGFELNHEGGYEKMCTRFFLYCLDRLQTFSSV